MKKRLISMLLSAALFVTSIPMPVSADNQVNEGNASTAVSSEGNQGETQENGIDYKMNGGAFTSGYEAPDAYPAGELPTEENITKAGYEFGGWYEDENFSGERITSLDTADHSGAIVLYAKWIERYYYIDIPQTVSADGGTLSISAKAGGFYDKDYVSVSVASENDWKLKNGKHALGYELRGEEGGTKLENNSVVTSLSAEENKTEENFNCTVTDTPSYTGEYTDKLTFDIAFEETRYTVHYETNGGTQYQDTKNETGENVALTDQSFPAGTALANLPEPVKKSATFIGWCYDAECTKYVDSKDRLLGDITLYAAYTDTQPLDTVTMETYARAYDVATDFTILITDTSGKLTAEELRQACTIKNVSDPSEEIVLSITENGDQTFTVGKENGWTEGASYKLELKNNALYFTGYDTSIREYDFTVYKAEIENAKLRSELKYIHTNDLSDLTVNGQKAKSVSVAVMTVGADGSVQEEGSETSGTFTYTKQKLSVGDKIAVYSGDVIPTMELSSGENSDVSFFEITAVNGTSYSYRGAEAEDVLFMPDVIPLLAEKDKDGDLDNNSATVAVSDLTFGDDEMSQAMNLNSETTIDAGDFLAFYTDINSETLFYGEIQSVIVSGEDYILDYVPVSWEEIQIAMDVYRTEKVDGNELLEDTDRGEFEDEIEQQAVESGFANEVVERIAEAAMQTESFEELEQSLSNDLGAGISLQPNTNINKIMPFAGGKPGRVTAELDHVKANLGTTLKHFDGDISGVRMALDIGVKITIKVAHGANIEILVTATFEQEVRVNINVNGKAVWKRWGIFPYIADYRVTASFDLYEYTGIGLNVNFKVVESGFIDNGSKLRKGVNKITEELKSMMENGEDYLADKSKLSGSLGDSGDDISVSKSLAERYSELLEEDSDWVEIYNRKLLERHFRVLLIIDIEVRLDFVVSANVNISMGMSYWYKNAKRYVFCVKVKDRSATSDTIDLCEEQYEFTAYAMGTLGLRAGVRLTIKVGLISTKLASVGISAEAGGYAQVWGYLYYELKYAASTGRQTRAMGAIYLEIGIYLEIKFQAQALANAFTYSPTLYENEWPLYRVGSLESVLDFVYTQNEVEEISMKRDIQSVQLSDNYFKMQYMHMKDGLNDGKYFEKIYDDNSKYFNIVMTNPAFSYDPATNIISVDPQNKPEQDGEMIITWKNQEGTFNTKAITRKISLHWDKLWDGYYIAFQSNGGSYIETIVGKYNVPIQAPKNPVRLGYNFAGWYSNEELTKPYTIPTNMPDNDALVYAKWEAADVDYTVVDYVEKTNGVYEAQTPVKYKAKTGSKVTPTPTKRTGFETPPEITETIQADGSTEIEYYYAREQHKITFESEGEILSQGIYKYGSLMPTPAVYRPGYEFDGWDSEVPENVPAEDKTYRAKWKPLDGIAYSVKYYIQNPDGEGYEVGEIKTFSGKTAEEVTAPEADYDEAVYHLKGQLPKGKVKADGSLVLKVYYDLNEYKLTYDPDGGILDETEVSAKPGDKISLPVPIRDGYTFEGWYLDKAHEQLFGGTMPREDCTVYAKWETQKVNYTVRHLQEVVHNEEVEANSVEIDPSIAEEEPIEENNFELVEEEVFSAKTGEMVTPAVKSYTGFTAPETVTEKVLGDGSLVIEYRYQRNMHEINLVFDGKEIIRYWLQYGASIVETPGRMGYLFGGWYTDDTYQTAFSGTMPDNDLSLYAKWEPTDSEYIVRHYKQDLPATDEKTYTLVEEEVKTALTDSEVTPEVKTYEGFVSPSAKKEVVSPYGDTSIEYYYDRVSNPVTYVQNNGEADKVEDTLFGEEISYIPKQSGYAFVGWYLDEALTKPLEKAEMPAHSLKLYAKWELGKKSYRVNHYIQEVRLGENYELAESENFIGTAGEMVAPEVKTYEGFTSPEKQYYELQVSDDMEVFNYYYQRNSYNVTIDRNDGSENITLEPVYEAKIEYRPEKMGYQFAGWYLDKELKQEFDGTVPAKDLTLYAKWEAQDVSYSVRHYLQNANDDGYTSAGTESFTAKTDSSVTPEVKTYAGFTSPETQTATVTADGTLNITYRYLRNTHTLTEKFCDGREDKIQTMRYGSAIAGVSKAGYTFAGWYLDENYETAFTGTMPDQDLTLYAKWEAKKINYVVEHYQEKADGNGYVLKEREIKTADTDSTVTPEVTSYTGFTSPQVQTKKVDGAEMTVIQYHYTRNVHRLTFVLENGEADKVSDARYQSTVTEPNPKREGYTFVGWDKEVVETMPDNDETYTAVWMKNTYTIRFNTEGGNEIKEMTLEYGEKITKPKEPERKGYKFVSWNIEIPSEMPAKNLMCTAIWKKETYTISYNLNGGSASNPESYDVESRPIRLETPKRTGYTFIGWSGTGLSENKMTVTITKGSTENRSYTANWKENTYTIRFTTCGVGTTGSMSEIKMNYTQTKQLPDNKFVCKGYTFIGWSYKANQTIAYYRDHAWVSKLSDANNGVATLYPVWKANTYKVTFDYGYDNKKSEVNCVYNKNYSLPQNVTRYGWTFEGWKLKNATAVTYKPGKKNAKLEDAENIVLHASWKANNSYSYRPSSSSNRYLVTDDHELTKFTFYVDGNQTSVKTTGDTGQNPARYHLNMTNLSYQAVHNSYSKMKIKISFKITMEKDGYADLRVSYHSRTQNKTYEKWKTEVEDIKAKNGETVTYTYTKDGTDADNITLEFDAHGKNSDKYYLSNLNVDVTYE